MNASNNVRNQAETDNKRKNENFDFVGPIDSFIEESVGKNPFGFKGKNKNDIWDDFMSFLSSKPTSYDVDTINSFEEGKDKKYLNILFNAAQRETISYQNLYSGTLSLFRKNYEFSPEENTDLETALKKQNKDFLRYLQSGDVRRRNFLKKHNILPEEKIEETARENEEKILEKIFQNRVDVSAIEGNKNVMDSLKRFSKFSYLVTVDDLRNVLKFLGDDNEAKKMLIQFFVPRISLKEALDYGLLDEQSVKDEATNQLISLGLSNDDIKSFLENEEYDDFYVETSSFGDSVLKGRTLKKILEKALNEYKESLLKIEVSELNSIEDFVNKALKTSYINEASKEAFSNFGEGTYIKVKTKTKSGDFKIHYLKVQSVIENAEDGEVSIVVNNITNSDGGIIKNDGYVTSKRYSLDDFFKFLEEAHNSNGVKEYSFYSNKDILKTEESIKETPFLGSIESGEITTKEELKKVLDDINPENKDIKLEEMAFRFKESESLEDDKNYLVDEYIYSVSRVTDTHVFLEGEAVPLSFQEFAIAFAEKKPKRFKKVDTPVNFFNSLKINNCFKGLEFSHGRIIPEGNHHYLDTYPEGITHFVDPKGNFIDIKKITPNGVTFELGEYKEAKEEDKKKGEKNVFKYDGRKGTNFDFNTLFIYLSSKNFTPIYDKDNHDEHHGHDDHSHGHGGEHFHRHGSLFGSWLGWWSVGEMAAGYKHVTHAIEHKLKFNSDLKGARFARFLGKAIPHDGIQFEIQSHVEQEESKSMEAKIKELKGMSTWKMIKEVEHILQTAKPFDPILEAALFAVVGKTGYLYPKNLKKWQGQYVWYEALGGKVGDKIFMDFKKECEEAGRTPFTEEYLVEKLLDHQVDKLDLRRNKFNKQYGNVLKEGKKDEEEDGERKTRNKTRASGRYEYIVGEFKNLTYWNGIGGMENLLGKGPDPGELFGGIPFIILTTGMSQDFVPEMVNTVFGYSFKYPTFGSLFLSCDDKNLEIYNNYVAKVIELMNTTSTQDGKKSEMYKEFKELGHGSRPDRIEKAEKFWNKYGKELYPKINMSDGFVTTRMDDKGNGDLRKYYDKISSLHSHDDFKKGFDSKGREYVDVGFIDQVNSPIAATGGLISKIKLEKGKFNSTASKKIALMYLDNLSVATSKEANPDEEKRKKEFKKLYTWIERQISSEIKDVDDVENYTKYSFYQDIAKYGIELFPNKYTYYNDKDHPDSRAYDAMLDAKWEEFKHKNKFDIQLDFSNSVKDSVDNILGTPSNDNQQQIRKVA